MTNLTLRFDQFFTVILAGIRETLPDPAPKPIGAPPAAYWREPSHEPSGAYSHEFGEVIERAL